MTPPATRRPTRAVFFDVDFTLIHPGPMFQGPGYRDFCARYGITTDPARFADAVAAASALLDSSGGIYDPQIFVELHARDHRADGRFGPGVDQASRDIYEEWAACQHFSLYDDVPDVIRELHARGLTIGLISNTQRCLSSFQSHFDLDGMFAVAVSSAAHGFMKPHPSIFQAALAQANATVDEAVMVGDSLDHDIHGARRVGMRAVLVSRSGLPASCPEDVPVITTLRDLPALL